MNLIRSIYATTAATIGLCLALPFACTDTDAMAVLASLPMGSWFETIKKG